ncbi:MAG TPA: lysophospholipid acyltransferase family protein [Geobacterales bacterium]|nr:lysophospholipid acyltransferase family protein [Geobacterales bacterium]
MLRSYLFILFFFPFTLAMSLVTISVSILTRNRRLVQGVVVTWARACLAVVGVRVVVEGVERIPTHEPVIFMANHQSNLDIPVLTTALPVAAAWVAKEELFRYPLFGTAMRRAGYIPLNRSQGRQAIRSINAAAETIQQGTSVTVFPEGTRSFDGVLLPFRRGVFILARRSGVPVVPLAIVGSIKLNRRGSLINRSGTIHLRVAHPIPAADVCALPEAELMERVRRAIADLLSRGDA